MSEPEQGEIRVTDKRGQGTRQSAPVAAPEDMSPEQIADMQRRMAEQAAAAETEAEEQPGLRCAAFVMVSIDHNGLMHLHHQTEEIAQIIQRGIRPERPANSSDLMNMANQLQVMVTGSEVASRVMEALQTQAQLQMARAAGAHISRAGG